MDFLQGKTIIRNENELILADVALKKKVLILYYFTSGNCENCRKFDVRLKEMYREAIGRMVDMAVIVVSFDSDKETFGNTISSYYDEWFALRHDDDLLHILVYNYGVTHIPFLVVVRHDGEVVTKQGRPELDKMGINVLVTWTE